MGNKCEHYAQANDQISPNTKECEECEKEKTPWVALRMCLTCGHVGCCDSSVGLHEQNISKRQDILLWLHSHQSHGNGAIFMRSIIDVLWHNMNLENGTLMN